MHKLFLSLGVIAVLVLTSAAQPVDDTTASQETTTGKDAIEVDAGTAGDDSRVAELERKVARLESELATLRDEVKAGSTLVKETLKRMGELEANMQTPKPGRPSDSAQPAAVEPAKVFDQIEKIAKGEQS